MDYKYVYQKEENYTTPVDSPAYGPQPTIYRDVVFDYVYFRTDPGNIAPLLPEFFKPGSDGLCAAFSINVPFSSCYGPFLEMGVVVQVEWQGKQCFYMPALYLNNDSAIAAGREIYGSPKKHAQMSFKYNAEIFTASATRADVEFMKITTKVLRPGKAEDFPAVFPIYNLKMIPSIEGPWPEVKQLTTCGIDKPVEKYFYECAGTVEFAPSCNSLIHLLQPEEIISASRSCMDYEQGWGKIEYDFLKNK